MEAESRRKLQLLLAAALAIAAARAGYIVYDRYQTRKADEKPKSVAALNADDYVMPKKLYPHDLKSARELTQQPVWVKVGYGYAYYPYQPERKKVEFAHPAGTLGPLQKLQILDVVTGTSPDAPGTQQILATFELDGKSYAVPVGVESGGDYTFHSDDMFFIQDPHGLYKHWSADVWASIDRHEVRQGMSQLQAGFALGMVTAQAGGDSGAQTLTYPNGGKPMTITFRGDKAVEIRQGA